MVQEGTRSTYKSTVTFSHKICHLTFAKMQKMSAIHDHVDNMTALTYLLKMGGTKNPELIQIKRNLGVSTWADDRDYCRTFTRKSQLQGRLGISAPEGFLRIVTVRSSFQ